MNPPSTAPAAASATPGPRPVAQLQRRRKIHAPREKPQQVEQPEVQPRHRVVVPRIPQVQKPQHVLVDEVEPEEPVIRAPLAVHREIEIRRIAQRRQHVPRRRDRQRTAASPQTAAAAATSAAPATAASAPGTAAPPPPGTPPRSAPSAAAPCPSPPTSPWPTRSDAAPLRPARAAEPHSAIVIVERQHHVRNQDAREQKQPDARRQHQPRVQPRPPPECPRRRTAPSPSTAAPSHSAIGIRAAQSCTPKIRNDTAIIQYFSGDFSR